MNGGRASYPATARRAVCEAPDIDLARSPRATHEEATRTQRADARVRPRPVTREAREHFVRDSSNAFFTRHFCVGEGSFTSSSQSSTSRKDARVASDAFTRGLPLSRARFRGDFSRTRSSSRSAVGRAPDGP